MSEFIDIVFTEAPGPQGASFVEVEDDKGRSIKFGNWIKRDDGFWALRIAPSDLRSTQPVTIPMPIGNEEVRLTEIINTAAAIIDEETQGEQSAARHYLRDLCMQFSQKYFEEYRSFPYAILAQALRLLKHPELMSDTFRRNTIQAAEAILNDHG